MANDAQYRPRARIVATRGVREYRQTIPALVDGGDLVLEVGCEWGTTTELLARHARHVVGTDVSPQCIERARQLRPGLDFRVIDAFDLRAVMDVGPGIGKVYMDLSGLSGYRGLLDLIALVNSYATVLGPDTIVVKSGALRDFATRCTAWRAPGTRQPEPTEVDAVAAAGSPAEVRPPGR